VLAHASMGCQIFFGFLRAVMANVSPDGADAWSNYTRRSKRNKQFLSYRAFYCVPSGSDHRIVMARQWSRRPGLLPNRVGRTAASLGQQPRRKILRDGSPNSEGVSPYELRMASTPVADTPEDAPLHRLTARAAD